MAATVRAPEGERRSLESMVFVIKLPDWEVLERVVMRYAVRCEGVGTGIWDGAFFGVSDPDASMEC